MESLVCMFVQRKAVMNRNKDNCNAINTENFKQHTNKNEENKTYGFLVGPGVGLLLGLYVGISVGSSVGALVVGLTVGTSVGALVVGSTVGNGVGLFVVGLGVGSAVGNFVGSGDGGGDG